MKTDKEINEIIKQGLEEYAKAETKPETMEVKFSKEHEEKMKAMFDNMRKDNKSKKPEDRELVIHIKFNWLTKVAVAIIVVGVFVSAVSKGIKAWRECKLNSYEGESGEYSWLLPNDTSEMYKPKNTKNEADYVRNIFPGLSGEITGVMLQDNSRLQRINFKYNGRDIFLKFGENRNLGFDSENVEKEIIYVDGINVVKYKEKEFETYIWNTEEATFMLYGDLTEINVKQLIQTMNYEKIETNF